MICRDCDGLMATSAYSPNNNKPVAARQEPRNVVNSIRCIWKIGRNLPEDASTSAAAKGGRGTDWPCPLP